MENFEKSSLLTSKKRFLGVLVQWDLGKNLPIH